MTDQVEAKPRVYRGGYTKEMRAAKAAQMQRQDISATVAENPHAASVAASALVDNGIATQGESQVRHTRVNRKPFGSTNQKLAYPPREGYHRHWFNDNPGRIEYATEEAGYTHVKDSRKGKNVQRVVGTREGGHPITAYLLEIPQEWFDDDMARYEKENAARDEAIRRGAVKADKPEDVGRFYPQAQGRRISVERR